MTTAQTSLVLDDDVIAENVHAVIDFWLRYRQQERKDLAGALGMSEPMLSQRVNGKTKFKPTELLAASLYLREGRVGPTVDDMLRGFTPTLKLVPTRRPSKDLTSPCSSAQRLLSVA